VVPHIRDRRAREITRKTTQIGYHFHDIRIAGVFRCAEAHTERRHVQRRIVAKRLDRFVNGRRFDERLVALKVHDEIAIERVGNLGDPIGARRVARTRHAHVAAESRHGVGDARIVGRDQHGVDIASAGGAAIHVFDHRTSGDVRERFTRKTAGRVAGRDDNDSMFMVLGTIADAFGATCGTHVE